MPAEPGAAPAAPRPPRHDLSGRTAIVTGAAQGIGLAIARDLAAAGAEIVLADWSNGIEAGAEEIREGGGRAEAFLCDVTREDDVTGLVERAARGGRLDILVNNAAILVSRHASRLDRADWQQVIDVNLTACFFLAQAAARRMEENGGGAIVNLGSIVGRVARKKLAAYIAAKAGIDGLTRALACDLAGTGIRVNAVAPGFIETQMSRTNDPAFGRWVESEVPVRRWGRPEDVAGVVSFLASDAAAYVNGQTIYVDGGFTAVSA